MNLSQKYSDNEVSSLGQVELESRALIKSAAKLNHIKENWEVEKSQLSEALDKNRLLWTVIASAMQEDSNLQSKEIKTNITNLALFIFQRTISLLAEPKPEGLDILININMNIAKGLGEHPKEEASPA